MNARRSRWIGAVAMLAAMAGAVGGCGGSAETEATGTAPATTTGASTQAAATTTAAAPTVVSVAVRAGSVTGGGRRQVGVGEPVAITVVADVTDEVHVHGYDRTADVAPGAPATIRFVADIPGIFDVELESSGLKLFDLVVR